MSGVGGEKPKYRLVHVKIEEELYRKLWDIVKKRYTMPIKKLHLVLNEALRKGIEQIEKEETK
jgi:hypothetical protein